MARKKARIYYDERKGVVLKQEQYAENMRDRAVRYMISRGLDMSYFQR